MRASEGVPAASVLERPSGTVVRMLGVTLGYGRHPAVHEVDFRLARGEVVALVGPNGSGKTTLVRGVVELFGTTGEDPDERRRIGYVPQRHTVAGAIPCTVEEVVGSGRLPRRRWMSPSTREDRRMVAEAIDALDQYRLDHCGPPDPQGITASGSSRVGAPGPGPGCGG